ncbi:MAG: D-alanyl-D-alanine carboxypeptidase [Firmicutes bacterium]|nr:D-alanyl-D-alanine carboxypeptidase [Bacillota bacterium]
MMRKYFAAFLFVCLLLHAGLVFAADSPLVTARSGILMDQATGRILFSKNAHEQLPMASTTKIMTAILAFESGRMAETVIVSEYASLVEGSAVDLEAGEEKTVEELVYALMLRSGNDAATAIAEHLGGSVEKFAEKMTRRARELGATQTSFLNPHGLHQKEHYSTAYDLALIGTHAMSLPQFREVIAQREKRISWTGRPYDRVLRNQNKLLQLYETANGIKTGWTSLAGRCFVGAAARNGWQLVTVVLNAPQMWEDTIRLLDFGYAHYHWQTVIEQGRPLKTVEVQGGMEDRVVLLSGELLGLPLKENEAELLRFHFEVPKLLRAPLQGGEKVGSLHIYFGSQQVGEVPLVAASEVRRKGLGGLIWGLFDHLFSFVLVPLHR